MIEIIQRKDSQEEGRDGAAEKNASSTAESPWQSVEGLPKNFRQIGTPEGNKRVYIEDYVYTYLHPSFSGIQEHRICILVGETKEAGDCLCIYVSGALELQGVNYCGNAPILSEATRAEICMQMEKYFPGTVLLGWFYDEKGVPPRVTPEIERVYRNFFGGSNRILLLSDSLERDETLFLLEDGAIRKKSGYYIYYERNPNMQEYMIRSRQDTPEEVKPEEVRDEALKNYREMVLRRSEEKPSGMHSLVYGTGLLVVVAVCVIGITMFNNYEKMKDIEEAVRTLRPAVESTESDLVIENLEGGVEPEDNGAVADGNTPDDQQAADSGAATAAVSGTSGIAGSETTGTSGAGGTAGSGTAGATGTEGTAGSGTAGATGTEGTAGSGAAEASPDSSVPASATPALTAEQQALQQGYYIVQSGDSLTSISKRLYQTPDRAKDICAANGIEDMDSIFVGQKLILPN